MIVDNIYVCKHSLDELNFQDVLSILKQSVHKFYIKKKYKDVIINTQLVINEKIDHKGNEIPADSVEICYYLIF